jgi:hypothetical protein
MAEIGINQPSLGAADRFTQRVTRDVLLALEAPEDFGFVNAQGHPT